MSRVGILDYGVGNLRSVRNALQHVGATSVISDDPDILRSCDRLVFPGVGAFAFGISALQARGLDRLIVEASEERKPVLGICLGMQLLFESSSEFGSHHGLGIFPGHIGVFSDHGSDNKRLRLPNVGWLPVHPSRDAAEGAPYLMEGIPEFSRFYFVHSYHATADVSGLVATSEYAGLPFAAIVARGSVIGTQFHPEKSGPAGLQMLRNFASWEVTP